MSALRPLPPRPSLEFERKEAKALLRRLRAGDPAALARASERHPAIDATQPTRTRLADAQLVIAREYGFTSWPRLVRYFADVDRQQYSYHGSISRRESYEGNARWLLREHRERRARAARMLAAYIPRLYGMRAEDVFASSVTEDEARLAVARGEGFPSWDVLLERTQAELPNDADEWYVNPRQYAGKAIEAGDLDELKRVVETYPDVLHPSDYTVSKGGSLLRTVLHHERRKGVAALRPIREWLAAQGLDFQSELNRQLCGHMHMKTEKVRWLLDRGADPNWVGPNGIPVLEYALIRYWNGEAVDLVAARTVPRKALWIAAGLGDVDGVGRSLDRRGKPTVQARRLRPDFVAIGPMKIPAHPDADDEEILMEAFFVAMLNGRMAVLEYMVSRGFPVNSLVWEAPVIHMAAANAMVPLVECLIRCGADLDLRGPAAPQSAREVAREMFEQLSESPDRRRTVELCGMDTDAILAERDARPVTAPTIEPKLQEALDLAADDAHRLGHPDVRPENLLFGLLRAGRLPLMFFTKVSRIDLDRFRTDVADRVHPVEHRVDRPALPLHPDARATIQAAIELATERRRETLQGVHLLYALTQDTNGAAANLLASYGSSAAMLNAALERAL